MTRFRDGQEDESGIIRRDPARVRGRGDDQGTGEKAWSQHAIALAEELAEFERPMPVMDDYDLLLAEASGGIQ
jgi:hypothetical protein